MIGNIKVVDDGNRIKADSDFYGLPMCFDDFFNNTEYKKFIKNVEKTIRSSREYKNYIMNLKVACPSMSSDNIQSNINHMDADIEMHHYPLTLYDIVDIIATHKAIAGDSINSFVLFDTVMREHYDNNIGLVPLSKTNHQLAHKGHIFISLNQVYGKYKTLLEKYSAGITEDTKYKLGKLNEYTDLNVDSNFKGVL